MCRCEETTFLCEGCGAITHHPRRLVQCEGSKRSGCLEHSCRYFRQYVTLMLISPGRAATECYHCSSGGRRSAEANHEDWRTLRHYIQRSILTQQGWSRARSHRHPDDLYGPLHMNVFRRPSSFSSMP